VAASSAAATLITHARVSTAEHELHLVRGAIDVIAAGSARRVTLVAVQSAEAILPEAQALAAEHGVIVRAVWRGDLADIAVEQVS
jgi:hypothetical protein